VTSLNIERWLLKNRDLLNGRILEVGSRHYGDRTLSLRETLLGIVGSKQITGVDITPGENVDVVADLATEIFDDLASLHTFDTIVCLSVLEHVPKVWVMAANLERLLNPGGAIFISVPFVFRFHQYPVDCWRITHQGIVNLFPQIDFLNFSRSEALSADGSARMSLSGGRDQKLNRFISGAATSRDKMNRKSQKRAGDLVDPYLIRPTMLNFVGRRR
jgi:SAM-dependent methyltransferase